MGFEFYVLLERDGGAPLMRLAFVNGTEEDRARNHCIAFFKSLGWKVTRCQRCIQPFIVGDIPLTPETTAAE